jgi:hypothetical protein
VQYVMFEQVSQMLSVVLVCSSYAFVVLNWSWN